MIVAPFIDPPDDSPAWHDLLGQSYLVDGDDPGGLWQALLGLREYGAALEPQPDGGVKLVAGTIDPAEYRALRARWLEPHGMILRKLLANVRA